MLPPNFIKVHTWCCYFTHRTRIVEPHKLNITNLATKPVSGVATSSKSDIKCSTSVVQFRKF